MDTCGQFHKHFMRVTYGPTEISCTVRCIKNARTYFATAVRYEQEMFMKLIPGARLRRSWLNPVANVISNLRL